MSIIKGFTTFSCVLLLSVTLTFAQKVQWASKVIKFSSEYSELDKSANQILRAPNVLPRGGDAPTAWAVEKVSKKSEDESPKAASIRVSYESPMRIKQVAIAESFNPGAIERVIIYGADGEKEEIYKQEPKATKEKFRMLNIFLSKATDYFVKEIELILQPGKVDGWNQIDAIGISDSNTDTIKAFINEIKNLKFNSAAENLGKEINSIYDETSPKISPDGKTLYYDRKFHPDNVGGYKDEDDIWFSTQLNIGKWTTAQNIGKPLNDKYNNFIQGITPDGNTLLLGNIYKKEGGQQAGVSISNKTKDGWGYPEPQIIDGFYNNSKSVNYYLSNDGMSLIMALERKDTYGQIDLYVSFRKGENSWSEPKNLGPTINTTMNDYSPFLAADGVTLFYSTSGLAGYGKEDIFFSTRLDSTWQNWSDPKNLGSGINTAESDSKYNIPASGEYAYYSSTNNSLGKNDIFRIKLPELVKPKPVVLIKGLVRNERTMAPVGAKIIYEILPDGKEAGIARSNPTTGEFTIILPAGKKYGFLALADGYYSVTKNLDVSDITEYTELEENLMLAPVEVGQVVRLNNIFFEYGKATLTPESFPELDRTVQFLESNAKVEIEIGGHTDDKGSDVTNQKLSQGRAQAVGDYLISKGVKSDRLKVIGYGETRPIAFNTTEEGRQQNRRVEFIIKKK